MANADPSRLGAVNQGADKRELFLKVFAGEVLTSFEQNNIMLDLTTVRTISHGKSAQFPVTGRIGTEYHVPGTEITGMPMNHAERIITIDDLLISHAFIADIDDAMNHYEVRSIYSTEMGRALARQMDSDIIKNVIKAARSGPVIADPDYPGGTQIKNDDFKAADVETKAKALAAALFQAAEILDDNEVPEENRYAVFRPAEYYALAQNLDLINRWFGGTGAIADGTIYRVAGIEIKKHTNVPKTDDTATSQYHGIDATKTVGAVWTPAAVGTVKLMDLSLQSEWDIRRQGTLMVARYAVGHGVLRPECAIELMLDQEVND